MIIDGEEIPLHLLLYCVDLLFVSKEVVLDNIETLKIPGPCKTCGSPDRYFDSKGFARCRPCRKKATRLLGAKKQASGIPAPMCDVHNIQKYWDNFGNATCPQCHKEKNRVS